jgi:hypothetical protein
MSDHEYNKPGIGPIEFLQAVMHDVRVKHKNRRKAAKALADLQIFHAKEPRPDIHEFMRSWCNEIAEDVAEAKARLQ